jgi:hypothetical protein
MQHLFGFLAIFLFSLTVHAQAERREAWLHSLLNDNDLSKVEQKTRITKLDFAPLWIGTENSSVFGFIGQNYQRLRIKIISVRKLSNLSDTYSVSGRSMVNSVVQEFTGTMKVTQARIRTDQRLGVHDEYKNKVRESGIVVGEYHFSESRRESSTGKFDGAFATYWYIDREGRLRYDDIESQADGFLDNQFVGNWTSYSTGAVKIANWGDFRIPLSGDLDIGAGEFSPDDKYLKFGWQSYRDAYINNDRQARLVEEREWWK